MIVLRKEVREKLYVISTPLTDTEYEMKSIAELYNRLPVGHPEREKLYKEYIGLCCQNLFD